MNVLLFPESDAVTTRNMRATTQTALDAMYITLNRLCPPGALVCEHGLNGWRFSTRSVVPIFFDSLPIVLVFINVFTILYHCQLRAIDDTFALKIQYDGRYWDMRDSVVYTIP